MTTRDTSLQVQALHFLCWILWEKKKSPFLTWQWMHDYKHFLPFIVEKTQQQVFSVLPESIQMWHRHFGFDLDSSFHFAGPIPTSQLITSPFIKLHFISSRARDPLCLSWRWRRSFWPFLCGRSAGSSQSSSAVALCTASRSSASASLCQWCHLESGAWSM